MKVTVPGLVIGFVAGFAVALLFLKVRDGGRRQAVSEPAPSAALARPAESRAATAPATGTAATAAAPRAVATNAEQIATLRDEAANQRLRAEAAEGELEAAGGKPSEWPAGVAPNWQKGAVQKQFEAYVEKRGLGKVKEIDCSEYPCVAIIEQKASMDELHAALREMVQASYTGSTSLSISSSKSGDKSFAAVSVGPEDPSIRTRTSSRAREALQQAPQ